MRDDTGIVCRSAGGEGTTVTAVILGLLAALTNSAQALINKGLTERYPARQLIGVLYITNCLVLLPFAPFVTWHFSPEVWLLHVLSVALMVGTAICVWDLFAAGAASATTTASALSPIAALLASALLLPASVSVAQVVAAVLVPVAVLWALQGAFGAMGRSGVTVRVLGAAAGNGWLTVASALLADQGVGVVETYVVRTGLAAVVCIALFPPRRIPIRAAPRLLFRSLLTTLSFVCILLGVQQGSPVVIQTLVATTPLFVLSAEAWRSRTRPPTRALAAATLVIVGVAITLMG
jgi:drug/metabolite transporter (DMT)-like permease